MSAKKAKKDEAPDFEATMARLEETVRRLEAGDAPLEESLADFEKGVALVRTLHARLDSVQARIEELTRDGEGVASRRLPTVSTHPDAAASEDA
jgi:exodeoxyribonuclease VII small subunit